MEADDIRYCIILTNKYTGGDIHLGGTYKTTKEAQEYIDNSVCEKCNIISITMITKDYVWKNRHEGFTRITGV